MLGRLQKFTKSTLFAKSNPLVVNAQNETNVIVLVLGWGGSVPRNFKKVLKHYEMRGVTTVLHTMPMLCPKFIRTSFEVDIKQAVSEQQTRLEKEKKAPVKFLVHLYSQNGALVYSSLLSRQNIPTPQKLIMDSAPSLQFERNPPQEAHALSVLFTSMMLNKAQYYHFPFTPVMRAVLYVMMNVSVVTDKLFPAFKAKHFVNYIQNHTFLRDHSPIIPTLFIYSTGDKLISAEGIQSYKKSIESRGTPTKEALFGNEVPHISTSHVYPEKYAGLIDEFFELRHGSVGGGDVEVKK